jgi:hypothetical protein
MPVKKNTSIVCGNQSGEDVKTCRLSGAIGSQQADRLAPLKGDAEVSQDRALSVPFANIDGPEPRIGRDNVWAGRFV